MRISAFGLRFIVPCCLRAEAVAEDGPDNILEIVAVALVDGGTGGAYERLYVSELDVAADDARSLGLFEKLPYEGPHFCEQSRHRFL